MAKQYIKIRGANEHNLKNISIDIPRNELVVLTGLSGSGKSSLAFDTIYAEGQRRYMESLSSYARQFLGQMEKPDVESIEGLSPAISIDQKSTNRNPRSTVGTVTEIYDYMRLLYARIGIPHCPKCGREIRRQTVDQMVDQIMALSERTKIQLLAPVVRGRKGRHEKVLEQAKGGSLEANFIEGMACLGGCVGGPGRIAGVEQSTAAVNAYGAAATATTPVENPQVYQLLTRLGLEMSVSLVASESPAGLVLARRIQKP